MADEVIGWTSEMSMKQEELMSNTLTDDNPLVDDVCDDWLNTILNSPYECGDMFPESANTKASSSVEKDDASTSIAINYSEIMDKLVNLITLDKALALHQESFTPNANTTISDPANNRKRSHDTILDELFPSPLPDDDDTVQFSTSPLPDHTYHSPPPKRQNIEDATAHQGAPVVEVLQQQQQPQIVKTTKYLERRKKNNIASKRSRETRKNRFVEMEVQANDLEEENERLRKRIEKLEVLTQQMKEVLVKRLAPSGAR